MTPTERLREMLDEHGVEWRTYRGIEKQITCVDSLKCVYEELERGKIRVIRYFDTPAEAIEGTFGRGECKLKATTVGWSCSKCKVVSWQTVTRPKPNFCPNCGRKVVDE